MADAQSTPQPDTVDILAALVKQMAARWAAWDAARAEARAALAR
jgi:hypothetical protein